MSKKKFDLSNDDLGEGQPEDTVTPPVDDKWTPDISSVLKDGYHVVAHMDAVVREDPETGKTKTFVEQEGWMILKKSGSIMMYAGKDLNFHPNNQVCKPFIDMREKRHEESKRVLQQKVDGKQQAEEMAATMNLQEKQRPKDLEEVVARKVVVLRTRFRDEDLKEGKINFAMTPKQKQTVAAMRRALRQANRELADGKPIDSDASAVKWLLEQVR